MKYGKSFDRDFFGTMTSLTAGTLHEFFCGIYFIGCVKYTRNVHEAMIVARYTESCACINATVIVDVISAVVLSNPEVGNRF